MQLCSIDKSQQSLVSKTKQVSPQLENSSKQYLSERNFEWLLLLQKSFQAENFELKHPNETSDRVMHTETFVAEINLRLVHRSEGHVRLPPPPLTQKCALFGKACKPIYIGTQSAGNDSWTTIGLLAHSNSPSYIHPPMIYPIPTYIFNWHIFLKKSPEGSSAQLFDYTWPR